MWKLTLGYNIGDALILGLGLVSKCKKFQCHTSTHMIKFVYLIYSNHKR
jgi:hypothetical protein